MDNLINKFINIIQNNQFLLTGLGLSGAGIITFWLKDFPREIINLLKKEFTTQMVLTSSHIVFHNFMKWIEINYSNKNFRVLKVTNGRWGSNQKTTTSIGYGVHWIFYKNRPLLIQLTKDNNNQSSQDKETVLIVKIGRSRKLFDILINELKTMTDTDKDCIDTYTMTDYWDFIRSQRKRSIDTIFIEKEKKDLLFNNIHRFIQNEGWYIDKAIPYQYGILLYGPPGTGKTSIIKAISSYLNFPIYYLPVDKLSKIDHAMNSLPNKALLVIEDIDTSSSTHKRRSKSIKQNNSNESTVELNYMDELNSISLSEILNALDGIFSVHGRILIATTNHIENLDPALIRPGRIDLKIEVGYVNNEILLQFINRFYKDNIDHNLINNLKIKPNITVAMLQNLILQNKSINDIIEFVSE
jgi:chaperone BCS1